MSKWLEVTEQDNISMSDDMRDVHILFDTDDDGNCYVDVPVTLLASAIAFTLMPCGHLARYVVSADEGTSYCLACQAEALRETAERRLGLLRESEIAIIEAPYYKCWKCGYKMYAPGDHAPDCALAAELEGR